MPSHSALSPAVATVTSTTRVASGVFAPGHLGELTQIVPSEMVDAALAATWAEAGVVTAADLLAGDEDPRPGAGSLIERSVATLAAAGVTARPKVRGDVGYFAKDIAQATVQAGCDFSLGVTRNPAVLRAAAAIPATAWRKAKRMKGAQVAVCDYAPAAGHRAR